MAKSKKKTMVKKKAEVKKSTPKEKSSGKKSDAEKTKLTKKVSAKKAIPAKKSASKKTTAKPVFKTSTLAQLDLHPLADRVLVKVETGEKMTPGGLYIPDTASITGNLKGQVLAAGHGGRNKKGQLRPLDVKTGDTVLFSEYVGEKINIDGQDVHVLRESEILGIVEK